MKRILFLLLLLVNVHAYSQKKQIGAIEVQTGYIYYFIADEKYTGNYYNSPNFGLTVQISNPIIKKLDYSIGINYSSKNYYWENDLKMGDTFYKRNETYQKQLKLPILLSYRYFEWGKLSLSFVNGLVVNARIDHDVKRYYDGQYYENNNLDYYPNNVGVSFEVGNIFTYKPRHKVAINLTPSYSYKFIRDMIPANRHNIGELIDDKAYCTINLGVKYFFD